MAQWSLLGREPLPDFPRFPAIRYPGFSDGLRLIQVDPFLPLAFLNETSTPISLGSAQSWSYPIDVLALTPGPPLLMLTAIVGFSTRHRDKSIPTETAHFAVFFPLAMSCWSDAAKFSKILD